METAAIYDVHGNISALEAVLRDIHAIGIDEIIIGGDVVPGPFPHECFEILRTSRIPVSAIRGNGEHAVLDVLNGDEPASVPRQAWPLIEWSAAHLTADDRKWIESWPSTLTRKIGGKDVMFCHATPRNDTEIFTRETDETALLPVFEGVAASTIVCGHTHMQFDRMVGTRRVINAGSVGMPFGVPGAYWLFIDNDAELRRTDYDLDPAAARVRTSAYVQAEQFA